jgi:hypothetical protein
MIYSQLEAYSDEFVLENLIGAVITLIIKFDKPDSTYSNFLKSYGEKVVCLARTKRLVYYKAVFLNHQRGVQ